MKKALLYIMVMIILLFLGACSESKEDLSLADEPKPLEEEVSKEEGIEEESMEVPKEKDEPFVEEREMEGATKVVTLEEIKTRYEGREPKEWGEVVTGVKTKINTQEQIIALTFDACGGAYDEELIQYLKDQKIPATLFISGKWIHNHSDTLVKLAEIPIFDIANHGKHHKPLSVKGAFAYGIPGTTSIEEVYHEVYDNHLKIKELTGHESKFFRSGTAYYDEIGVEIVEDLGEIVVNYNVLGDAGATFSANQIYESMILAEPGAIMLFHMNHPDSDVAEGVKRGIEALIEEGFEFVLLKDYIIKLQ